MTEADLIVRHRAFPTLPMEYWEAKCKHCGTMLTKYDDTREDCVRLALMLEHECGETGQLGLL